MYGPLNIGIDRVAQDAVHVQRKLGAGLQTLREVGNFDYGATARQEVWRDGKTVLYRFIGEKAPTAKVPLLLSYALVNRPYMVDLQEDRSLVKGLLALGEDVYIIDWGYPDRSDRFLTLEDYIERKYAEAAAAPVRLAREIRKQGARAAIALRPATPIEPYLDLLDHVDLVLVMSVEPGFGGQKFMPGVLDKVRTLRAEIDRRGLDVHIQVDGGIDAGTIAECAAAGCDVFVAGSAVYGAPDPDAMIGALRSGALDARA